MNSYQLHDALKIFLISPCYCTVSECGSLTCYQCTNLEILVDGSDMVKSAFSGTSDPSCGSYPSTINAKVCPDGYICGSFTGDVAQVVGTRAHLNFRISFS